MDILVVEDEREIAHLIQLYLEKEGFTVHLCHRGDQAVQMAQTIQPDVVVLDLMLPGLDGLEVCARIRQQPGEKDPYIMMVTAKGEELDRIIGLSTGADDYLVKPFSPRELVARVRALLRRSLRQGGSHRSYKVPIFKLIPNSEKRCDRSPIKRQKPFPSRRWNLTSWQHLSAIRGGCGHDRN